MKLSKNLLQLNIAVVLIYDVIADPEIADQRPANYIKRLIKQERKASWWYKYMVSDKEGTLKILDTPLSNLLWQVEKYECNDDDFYNLTKDRQGSSIGYDEIDDYKAIVVYEV